jgi:hypothetical protein
MLCNCSVSPAVPRHALAVAARRAPTRGEPNLKATVAVALTLALTVAAAVVLTSHTHTARATGTGPTIAVGTPSLVNGKLQVPVNTVGTAPDQYVGASVHLRWDARLFSFDSFLPGDVFGSAFCNPAIADQDGAGVMIGCVALGTKTAAPGLIVTIT